MATPTKSYYKIGEVSAMLGLSTTTLRYWEKVFEQLEPFKTPGGTRMYRPEDLEMCKQIKYLLREKGLSIEYAQEALKNYRKYPPRNPLSCKTASDALQLLDEAKGRCEDLHAVARIDAVVRWIKSCGDHD